MEDCESTDRDDWVEVEVNGKPVQPSSGALIVEKSQAFPNVVFVQAAKSEDSENPLLVWDD
jgi:hypothetical protein